MKNAFSLSRLAVAFCASASLIACGGQSDLDTDDSKIIGGVLASSKTLNAIGTVGMMDRSGNYQFFCSATLIGPSTVLTAKHCAVVLSGAAQGMKLVNLTKIFFAVGSNAIKPVKVVEAIAASISPVEGGAGFVGLGNDVSIYQLIEPITDIKPFKVATGALKDATTAGTNDIGAKFIGIGYGAKDIVEDITGNLSGLRRMGTETMRALKGKSFELLLGSFDAFYDQLVYVYGKDVVDYNLDLVKSWYNDTTILEGYEAWAGHAEGDVQTCHGDSGGPLVRKVGGEKQIYGVVSGGWFSRDLTCDYGTFYATIGPKTQELVKAGLAYTDPCRDQKTGTLLTVKGACQGNVATRCTDKYEGDRRKSVVNCAELDLVCKTDAAGIAGCVDASDTNPNNGVDTPADAPTVDLVKKDVEAAAQGKFRKAAQALSKGAKK